MTYRDFHRGHDTREQCVSILGLRFEHTSLETHIPQLSVIDDLEAHPLEVLPCAGKGAMRVFGVGAHQGHGVRCGVLRGSEREEGAGKFLRWGRPERPYLKVVGIVELFVIGQPEEAHEYPLALDDNGHG